MDQSPILQWNCKSLRPKTHELYYLIRKYSPILVAISETWLVPGSHYRVSGYSCLRDDRQDGYAGCALLVKHNLTYTQIVIPAHSPQINAVAVRVYGITYISIYIPHPNSCLIPDILMIISSIPPPIILMGDFNAHHTSWGSSQCDLFGYSLLDTFDEANLCVLNDGSPTRRVPPTQNPKSAVDLTACSPSLSLSISWEVLPLSHGSDHFPILINMPQRAPPESSPNPLLRHVLSKANWDSYSSSLDNKLNSIPYPNANNSLSCYTTFVKHIISSANEHIPCKRSYKNRSSPPWWDPECSNIAQQRNNAELDYNESMTMHYYLIYQRTAAMAKKLLSSKKKMGWIKFCESLSPTTPPSLVWKQIRRFRGYYNSANRTSNDPSTWLEAFADKLSPPFVHIALTFNIPNNISASGSMDSPFSFDELQIALNGLVDSSPGLDGIPYSFITKSTDKTKKFFLNLINNFYEQCCIPESWGTQVIIPLLKPGKDPTNPNSHRPIALSCVLAKIAEILIKNRVEWLVESKGLLAKTQFGFRKGMSTLDSISILTTEIHHSFKKKEYLIGVFLDIESAYDNVLLPMLRTKLLQLSIPVKIARFICCFLIQRSILIKTQNSYFGPRMLWKGLPQGSVLSPLLYSIYTCDLESAVSPFCDVLQYADDLALFTSAKTISEAQHNLNSALGYLSEWLLDHGLSVSASKSNCVVFTRKRYIPDLDIRYENVSVPQHNVVKFLGIWLDTRLTGVAHFNHVVAKCEKNINILRALSGVWWGSHPFSQKLLYNAIIRSHLDYGTFILDPGNRAALDKLSKIQSKCLRIVLGAMKSSPINAMQVECVDPPLHLRRQFLSDRFVSKLIQNPDHTLILKIKKLLELTKSSNCSPEEKLPCVVRSYLKFSQLPCPIVQLRTNPLFSISYDALIFQPTIILNFGIDKDSIEPCNLFYEIIGKKWTDWLTIYTDASKLSDDSEVGAAVWIPKYRIILSNKCPSLSSVFTGEAVAILEAILYISSHKPNKTIIFTDSKSCLQALLSNQFKSKSRFPLILKIKEALYKCSQADLRVVLAWIPGHVGIPGNETADSCAKQAVAHGGMDYYKVYSHDLSSVCRVQMHNTWHSLWQNSKIKKGKFYGQIQPSIPPKPWFFKFKNINKTTTSTICRLRLGHACTPVFLAKIRIRDHSLCECGLDEGTPDHIFFSCSRLRYSLYDKLPSFISRPANLSSLLSLVFTKHIYILSMFIIINKIKL